MTKIGGLDRDSQVSQGFGMPDLDCSVLTDREISFLAVRMTALA